MKGFSKSIQFRYKKLWKRKQTGFGKTTVNCNQFKQKLPKKLKRKKAHRVRQ